MRRELEQVEIPDEHGARERTWTVVRSAFAERAPVERRSLHLRPAIVLAVVVALLAAAFSSPGMAVLDRIRKTVGIERAAPALFSLPSPGKLLVRSEAHLASGHGWQRREVGRHQGTGRDEGDHVHHRQPRVEAQPQRGGVPQRARGRL